MAEDVRKLEMNDREYRVIRFVDGYRISKKGWWVAMPIKEAKKMAEFILDCEVDDEE